MHELLRRVLGTAGLVAVAMATHGSVSAQYHEGSNAEPPEVRYVSAGFLQRTFEPLGSNPQTDSLAIRYDRMMPVIGFRQGMVDIVGGYTRYRMNGVRREAVILSASVSQDVALTGEREHALFLPVLLSSDFARSEGTGPGRETFSIASLGIGTGLKFRSRGGHHEAWLSVVGVAHYAFEGLGTGGGFSPALMGEGTVLLPRAIPLFALALGYRFRLQSWSMSEEKFNYRSVSHGPYIGVVF